MKKIASVFLIGLLLCTSIFVFALNADAVSVKGYYRSNGTYVAPYQRSAPDSNPYNNYSFPGNTNPYTGKTAGGSSTSYLNNYYKNSSPSNIYSGGYSGIYSSGSSYTGSNTYSTPTTPTCPASSYYDSLSSSCKCLTGYLVQDGSCVSYQNYCWKQIGIMSQWNYLKNTCECSSGYVIDNISSQCTSGNTVCHTKYGYNSSYQNYSNSCVCDTGYNFDTSQQCVRNKTYSAPVYVPSYSPIFSSALTCVDNASVVNGLCTCKDGYLMSNNQCITHTQDCINTYGQNVYGVKGTKNNSSCYCLSGYVWNKEMTSCETIKVVSPTTITNNLKLGSSGNEVELLQIILINKKLLSDTSNGFKASYFGSSTKQALIKYQKSVKLKATGQTDQATRLKLNQEK